MNAGERNEADRIVAKILAAEREWAWTARGRGKSGAAKLCLAAAAAIEAAARRAQLAHCDDDFGLYSRRLVDELQARLSEWERRESDEDGYGSSCFYRVIDKVRHGMREKKGEMTDAIRIAATPRRATFSLKRSRRGSPGGRLHARSRGQRPSGELFWAEADLRRHPRRQGRHHRSVDRQGRGPQRASPYVPRPPLLRRKQRPTRGGSRAVGERSERQCDRRIRADAAAGGGDPAGRRETRCPRPRGLARTTAENPAGSRGIVEELLRGRRPRLLEGSPAVRIRGISCATRHSRLTALMAIPVRPVPSLASFLAGDNGNLLIRLKPRQASRALMIPAIAMPADAVMWVEERRPGAETIPMISGLADR